jgi:hypothetical protein
MSLLGWLKVFLVILSSMKKLVESRSVLGSFYVYFDGICLSVFQ